jgi:hypothetical protein
MDAACLLLLAATLFSNVALAGNNEPAQGNSARARQAKALFVGQIYITGNVVTSDYHILRVLEVYSGQPLPSGLDLRLEAQKLLNRFSGLFDPLGGRVPSISVIEREGDKFPHKDLLIRFPDAQPAKEDAAKPRQSHLVTFYVAGNDITPWEEICRFIEFVPGDPIPSGLALRQAAQRLLERYPHRFDVLRGRVPQIVLREREGDPFDPEDYDVIVRFPERDGPSRR